MARARNIKPGFFKNEELGTLTREARLLFIGLWTLADRNGRLEDRPARITAEVFPYDRDIKIGDVDTWLQMLADSSEGFIVRYVVGKTKYLQITNFAKHQSPHVKEQASTIPAPDMPGASPVQTPDISQPRQCVAPPDSLNPSSLNPDFLKEDLPAHGARTAPAPAAREIVSLGRFSDWWSIWSEVRGTANKKESVQAWLSVVTPDLVEPCIECTRSYVESLDDPRKGFNPDNFIFKQVKDKFEARWPKARDSPTTGRLSFTESVEKVMRERVAEGRPPL